MTTLKALFLSFSLLGAGAVTAEAAPKVRDHRTNSFHGSQVAQAPSQYGQNKQHRKGKHQARKGKRHAKKLSRETARRTRLY